MISYLVLSAYVHAKRYTLQTEITKKDLSIRLENKKKKQEHNRCVYYV